MESSLKRDRAEGALATGLSFVLWGLLPVYWKALAGAGAVEIIAHRIVWSLAFTAILVSALGLWGSIIRVVRSPRQAARLALSSALLSSNWLIYVWGVNTGRILETSLGYFVTPLVNVALGVVFLRERLRAAQVAALALAAAGVLNQIVAQGQPPWIALGLAATFAFYGLLRKTAVLDSLPGLAAETAVLTVPAGIYMAALAARGAGALGHADWPTHLLLAGTGVVTAVPLLLFAFGARRIRLTTVGILQYLSPTGTFLLETLVYHEPFDRTRAVTFSLIWIALAIYAAEGIRRARRETAEAGPRPAASDRLDPPDR
jgi:chloramphenicol-sensitive protein RarD